MPDTEGGTVAAGPRRPARLRRAAAVALPLLLLVPPLLAGTLARAETPGTTTRESVADGTPGAQLDAASGRPAMSADGRVVAFEHPFFALEVEEPGDPLDSAILLRDRVADTTELVSVGPAGAPLAGARSPAISADGNRVAFVARADRRVPRLIPSTFIGRMVFESTEGSASDVPDVVLANLDGTGRRNLTGTPDVAEREPALAPDGRRVAFSRPNAVGGWDVVVLDVATGAERAVTSAGPGQQFREPAWSPEGGRIAMTGRNVPDLAFGSPSAIFVVEVDAPDAVPVPVSVRGPLPYDPRDRHPAWSPEGHRIAFSGIRHMGEGGDEVDLYIVDVDTGPPQRVLVHYAGGGVPAFPRWSPDGEAILVVDEVEADLVLVTNLGQVLPTLRRLAAGPSQDTRPAWRADGERIVFSSDRGGDSASDLWSLEPFADDVPSSLQRVTTSSPASAGARHPDLERSERLEDVPAGASVVVEGVGGLPAPTGTVRFWLCEYYSAEVEGDAAEPCGDDDPYVFEVPVGPDVPLVPGEDGVPGASSLLLSELSPPLTVSRWTHRCWRVGYSGDDWYLPVEAVDADCLSGTRQEPWTSVGTGLGAAGRVMDVVFLGPSDTRGTGWVAFHLCGPDEVDGTGCATGGRPVGTVRLVQPVQFPGNRARSPEVGFPDEAGRYCWRATYGGDHQHQARTFTGSDAAHCFTVAPEQPEEIGRIATIDGWLSSGSLLTPGDTTQVTATLSVGEGAGPPPSAEVLRFVLCGPAQSTPHGCRSGGVTWGEVPVDDLPAYPSPQAAVYEPGYHCWRVEYRTDQGWVDADLARGDLCALVRAHVDERVARDLVWLRDRAAGTTTLVSTTPDGGVPDGDAADPAISPDGGHVAWATLAQDVTTPPITDRYPAFEVVLKDLASGVTQLVSVHRPCEIETTEEPCDAGPSLEPSVSEDGRFVAFSSSADDLDAFNPVTGLPYVDPYGNEGRQVYRRDLDAGRTTVESVAPDGSVSFWPSGEPSIDAGGGRIAFTSESDELVPGDENDVADVFLRDVDAVATTLVSMRADGTQRTARSAEPALSADGRSIAYVAHEDVAEPEPTPSPTATPSPEPTWTPSPEPTWTPSPEPTWTPSPEPTWPAPPPETAHVFVHDRVAGRTARVSVDSAGTPAGPGTTSRRPAISANGRVVAFDSDSPTLVAADTNDVRDVFVRDRVPVLVVEPDPLTFPPTPVGATTPPAVVTVTNTGAGPAVIGSVLVSGGDAGAFLRDPSTDGCSGATLHASESCTVTIAFRPTTAGELVSTLLVSSDDPEAPAAIALRGRGTVRDAVLAPDPLDFGTVRVGSASDPRVATLRSVGEVPLLVAGAAVSGTHPGDFVVDTAATTCRDVLVAPEEACAVTVRFAPTADGPREAALVVTTDAGSRAITLRGVGGQPTEPSEPPVPRGPGDVIVNPRPLDFGTLPVGTPSDVEEVVVISTGRRSVEVTGVTVTGGGLEFRVEPGRDGCAGRALPPRSACRIGLRFTPGDVGPRTALLRLDLDGLPTRTVRLLGRGGDRVLAVEDVDLGVVPPGETGEPQEATVRNTGPSPVRINAVAVEDDEADGGGGAITITGDGDGCSRRVLRRGESCAVEVVLAPTEAGAPAADLVIRSSAQRSPQRTALTGLAPELVPDPALGPPGFVTSVTGRFFPPDTPLVLRWEPGIGVLDVRTDADGGFTVPKLVLRRDRLGPREVLAEGDGYTVGADFLVVPGSAQPGDFTGRR